MFSLRSLIVLSLATSSTLASPPRPTRSLPIDGTDRPSSTLHIATDNGGHTLHRQEDADDIPGTLSLPVIHMPRSGLLRRDVEMQLENRSDIAYYTQIFLGTPPQPVYVQLDTGSFELWVNPDCSTLTSSADRAFCEGAGHYTPSDSSTSRDAGTSNTLTYGIGSANISYYVDSIGLAKEATSSNKLKQAKFGVADAGGTEDQFAGVLGLGYGEDRDDNLVELMAKQGLIDAKAFSVALGSRDEGGGVLVLGGVDTAKFDGELVQLPIVPADQSPDGMSRYWVAMQSISYAANASAPNAASALKSRTWNGTDFPIFLDTGSTMTLLPTDVADAMAADLGSEGSDTSGFYPVDCAILDSDGYLDFEFDGLTVRVPLAEMVRSFNSGADQTCYLGFSPSDNFALLGDSFLRSAYVVFDLDSDSVFMAQYDNCGSDVSKISSTSDLKDLKGSCGSGDLYDSLSSSSSSPSSPSPSSAISTATASAKVTDAAASSAESASAETTASPTAAINTHQTPVTSVTKPGSTAASSSSALAENDGSGSSGGTSPAGRVEGCFWAVVVLAGFVVVSLTIF
ncbi:Eukaryotic aspartyl protease [Geosmithia morbida]|uniref:Eukaryotic aspartyl protease n=1 Tax=Geosmithia morbida TaxID=1094350 RepID=A0A9P4YQK6_9HYPO|nr:Eukaryotic aspartyl protease [Geosmithia morbida]KAF4119801.1 Eukaryotic aspartyl protease [Geosmithia morbida]